MANEITTRVTSSSFKPSLLSRDDMTRIEILSNKLIPGGVGQYSIERGDAPAPAVLDALQRRARTLALAFAPSHPDDLDVLLTRFLAGYPNLMGISREESDRLIEVYVLALRGLPLWAVDAALLAVTNGATDPRFPPKAPELRALADEEMRPYRREQLLIDAVTHAKVYDRPPTEEEREAIIAQAWDADRPTWDENQEALRFAGMGTTGKPTQQQLEELRRDEEARKREEMARYVARDDERRVAELRRHGIQDSRPLSLGLRQVLASMGAQGLLPAEGDGGGHAAYDGPDERAG